MDFSVTNKAVASIDHDVEVVSSLKATENAMSSLQERIDACKREGATALRQLADTVRTNPEYHPFVETGLRVINYDWTLRTTKFLADKLGGYSPDNRALDALRTVEPEGFTEGALKIKELLERAYARKERPFPIELRLLVNKVVEGRAAILAFEQEKGELNGKLQDLVASYLSPVSITLRSALQDIQYLHGKTWEVRAADLKDSVQDLFNRKQPEVAAARASVEAASEKVAFLRDRVGPRAELHGAKMIFDLVDDINSKAATIESETRFTLGEWTITRASR